MALPPKWALGFGQSRYSYVPESKVHEVVEAFQAHRLPLDHVWLDIDWMKVLRGPTARVGRSWNENSRRPMGLWVGG